MVENGLTADNAQLSQIMAYLADRFTNDEGQ
jgi:hypothetical protein